MDGMKSALLVFAAAQVVFAAWTSAAFASTEGFSIAANFAVLAWFTVDFFLLSNIAIQAVRMVRR